MSSAPLPGCCGPAVPRRSWSERDVMRAQTASTRAVVVLIASKQEWASRSLESVLAPRGYAVLKTYTARDTLERAHADSPDVIVIDAQLPDADGLGLCREL